MIECMNSTISLFTWLSEPAFPGECGEVVFLLRMVISLPNRLVSEPCGLSGLKIFPLRKFLGETLVSNYIHAQDTWAFS